MSGLLRLFFEDGMQGSGQPVRNVISLDGVAHTPTFGGCLRLFDDCNASGLPDDEDIAVGTSEDCDGNGVPDECDLLSPVLDCNVNGVVDACDITSGASEDCDGNDVPDECEIDCNVNGRPDDCDLSQGTSTDENGNGTPDECDGICSDTPKVDCVGFPTRFHFGFSGSSELMADAGEMVEFSVFTLLVRNCSDDERRGPADWRQVITATGCEVVGASTDGTVAALVTEGGLREQDGSSTIRILSDPASLGRTSVVTHTVYLNRARTKTLNPSETPHRLLRLVVRATMPEAGVCAPCTLRYENLPDVFPNHVNFEEVNLTEAQFQLCGRVPGGLQVPGDANQDGGLDLSDAVWMLDHLFLGSNQVLPCDGGSAATPGPGARLLLDFNGDGGIDLSDPVSLLSWLFLGATGHDLGANCVRIPDCEQSCTS